MAKLHRRPEVCQTVAGGSERSADLRTERRPQVMSIQKGCQKAGPEFRTHDRPSRVPGSGTPSGVRDAFAHDPEVSAALRHPATLCHP